MVMIPSSKIIKRKSVVLSKKAQQHRRQDTLLSYENTFNGNGYQEDSRSKGD